MEELSDSVPPRLPHRYSSGRKAVHRTRRRTTRRSGLSDAAPVRLLRQNAVQADRRGDLVRQIADAVVRLNQGKKRHPILICDEAHLLALPRSLTVRSQTTQATATANSEAAAVGHDEITAFSPTDVPVLTRWAKILMIVQSAISLTTLALIAARAVNIL